MADAKGNKEGEAPAKPKRKAVLMLLILLVLAGGGGGAWYFLMGSKDPSAAQARPERPKEPVFLPIEPVVVNLADEGGERFVQLGVTLELLDSKQTEPVRKVLPTIRNGIIMILSQQKAADILTKEGKEKLADEILTEIGFAFGIHPPEPEVEPPSAGNRRQQPRRPIIEQPPNPVVQVLFSSLIIQ